MKTKRFFSVLFAFVAVFSFMTAGCDEDSGGGDPVAVNLSLPSAGKLPDFEGELVGSPEEAMELLMDVIGVIAENVGSSSGSSGGSSLRSFFKLTSLLKNKQFMSRNAAARPTYSNSFGPETINEEVFPGIHVKGFVEGNAKFYFKKKDGSDTVGDYEQMSGRAKTAVTLDLEEDDVTVKGKFTLSGNMSYKSVVKSVEYDDWFERDSANKWETDIKLKASNNYALSVSNGIQGMKFIMKLGADLKVNTGELEALFDDLDLMEIDFDTASEEDILEFVEMLKEVIVDIIDEFAKYFEFSLEVYDNNSSTPAFAIDLDEVIDIIKSDLDSFIDTLVEELLDLLSGF